MGQVVQESTRDADAAAPLAAELVETPLALLGVVQTQQIVDDLELEEALLLVGG